MNKEDIVVLLKKSQQTAKEERQRIVKNPELVMAKKILKNFQIERLKETHQDFLTSPDTKQAANFFLRELYSDKDLSKRDKDLEKLIPMMEKIFPLNALEVVTNAIYLDALTEQLDNQMVQELKQFGKIFTLEQYHEAYRHTNYDKRLEQIELIGKLGYSLNTLVNLPFIFTTLKAMRIPAKLAGLQDMHEFLNEGFNTFKETKNTEHFISALVQREKSILNDIFQKENKENNIKKLI